MSRFDMTDADRHAVEQGRQVLAAAENVSLLDENAMSQTIGQLEVALRRLVDMADAAASPQDPRDRPAPTYGPTVVQNVHDDPGGPLRAIVRVDFLLSHNELIIAFLIGYTEQHPDRDPAGMSTEEIRQVVEGWLAASSTLELARGVEELTLGSFTRQQFERLPALIHAVEDAYPAWEAES